MVKGIPVGIIFDPIGKCIDQIDKYLKILEAVEDGPSPRQPKTMLLPGIHGADT